MEAGPEREGGREGRERVLLIKARLILVNFTLIGRTRCISPKICPHFCPLSILIFYVPLLGKYYDVTVENANILLSFIFLQEMILVCNYARANRLNCFKTQAITHWVKQVRQKSSNSFL